MTASMRFEGSLNVELVEFRTNLIPYPRIHYPLVTFAPFLTPYRANHETNTTQQLMMACFNPANQMVKCDPSKGFYMACCLLFRGDIIANDINSSIHTIKSYKNIKFVSWSPTGFKVTHFCTYVIILAGSRVLSNNNEKINKNQVVKTIVPGSVLSY